MEYVDTTSELGWAAVRDVPSELKGDVERAETATMKWLRQRDRSLLDEAVNRWERICTCPEFSTLPLTFRIDALNRYAIACFSRGEVLNFFDDMEKAAALWNKALAWAPLGWPERAMYQHNLGSLAISRYQKTGVAVELENAIDVLVKAESSTSMQDRNIGLYLQSLALALTFKYDRNGTLEDLEAAIEYLERAVSADLPGTERYTTTLDRLGGLLRRRFVRSGEPTDIQRSVELLTEAVKQTKIFLPYYLTNLGNSVLEKFKVSGDPKDLEMAVKCQRKAVRLTEQGARSLCIRLNNLGNALARRYECFASIKDSKAAISAYRRSVELTSPGDPLLISRLFNLANALRIYGERRPSEALLEEATTAYRRACVSGTDFSLEWTIAASAAWGSWAARRQAWDEAVEAYRYGIQAIDSLYHSQLFPSNKNIWLKDYRNLATDAAYALAKIGCLTDAVITVEANRTRALAEALSIREANIDSATKDDRQQWLRLRERISELQSEASFSSQRGQRDLFAVATDLRQAHEALDATTTKIREYVPGFIPVGLMVADIAVLALAMERPITYLMTVEQGSLALIVQPPLSNGPLREFTVIPVWLNEFTRETLQTILIGHDNTKGYLEFAILADSEMQQTALDDLLPSLRERLIAPLVAALKQSGRDGATLIPSGLLSLLPLHSVELDNFVLSFAPSGRALQSAVKAITHPDSLRQVFLGVGNPLPQTESLDFAEPEVECIADLFSTGSGRTLCREEATLKNIKECLRDTTYVHFACHGTFDPKAPLESRLFLSGDDQLTLRNLLNGELGSLSSRMVALSACRSGITDFRNVPDEAIGLPSGFMQAGVPGIVGTLWPVDDVSTAVLMTHFYHLHLDKDEKLSPAVALYRAQAWLRTSTAAEINLAGWFERRYEASRRSDVNAFEWMTFYQAKPGVKPFVHPYFWAGFYFTGV